MNANLVSIADTVKLAAEAACKTRRGTGTDLQPMLHVVSESGQITIALLHIEGAGHEVVYAARHAILQMQPAQAVVLFEGWTHRKDLDPNDRDFRALQAGVIRPSQLPPHKRGELLTAFGESADGDEAYAFYYLEPDGSLSEMTTSWTLDESKGDLGLETHMRPLFLDRYLVRHLPPDVKDDMIDLLGSEKKLEHMANRAARKFLQAVGPYGFELPEYGERMDEMMTKMREQIGWRKGRAS